MADRELAQRLARSGAVLIEGPRACGKTATARQVAASAVMLDADRSARRAVAVEPGFVLRGKKPRLIDEWQIEPEIWNHVRHAVDERPGRGHFILTGSAVPPDDITRHTGAGRVSRLRMRPMSLFELKRSTGEISLSRLLAGEPVPSSVAELTVTELAELVCVGGWPGHLGSSAEDPALSPDDAMAENRDYLGEVCRTDIRRVDGSGRDPARVGWFLQSLGPKRRDLREHGDSGPGCGRARSLAQPIHGCFLPDRPRPLDDRGGPAAVGTASTVAIATQDCSETSLCGSVAGRGSPERGPRAPAPRLRLVRLPVRVHGRAGLSVCTRRPAGRACTTTATTRVWKLTPSWTPGLGRWAAFEIKLGAGRVDEAARTLLKFADRVDTERCGKPAALGVIVGSGYGYSRPDGVGVITRGGVGSVGPEARFMLKSVTIRALCCPSSPDSM